MSKIPQGPELLQGSGNSKCYKDVWNNLPQSMHSQDSSQSREAEDIMQLGEQRQWSQQGQRAGMVSLLLCAPLQECLNQRCFVTDRPCLHVKASKGEFPVFWFQKNLPPIQLANKKLKRALGGSLNSIILPFQWLGKYLNTSEGKGPTVCDRAYYWIELWNRGNLSHFSVCGHSS